jgi:hypothetical protein
VYLLGLAFGVLLSLFIDRHVYYVLFRFAFGPRRTHRLTRHDIGEFRNRMSRSGYPFLGVVLALLIGTALIVKYVLDLPPPRFWSPWWLLIGASLPFFCPLFEVLAVWILGPLHGRTRAMLNDLLQQSGGTSV